jgi:hypothetical protein
MPLEIVEVILSCVNQQQSPTARQHDLHACCLVSKSWYQAGIQYLYRAPALDSENFVYLTRTICEPPDAHVRTISLGSHVQDLDFSDIPRQGRNSLVARLLRRAGRNLEYLTAPNITLSITTLTPISKMSLLRRLNLLENFAVNLAELLPAIRGLQQLSLIAVNTETLSTFSATATSDPRWPPNLAHLVICGSLTSASGNWTSLLLSLPECTTELTLGLVRFGDYVVSEVIDEFSGINNITNVRIIDTSWTDEDIGSFTLIFPNLKHLSLAYDVDSLQSFLQDRREHLEDFPTQLERLSFFTHEQGWEPEEVCNDSEMVDTERLDVILPTFLTLRSLDLPLRVCLGLEEGQMQGMRAVHESLQQRWQRDESVDEATGLFLSMPVSEETLQFRLPQWSWMTMLRS